jgi:hypothetical protein
VTHRLPTNFRVEVMSSPGVDPAAAPCANNSFVYGPSWQILRIIVYEPFHFGVGDFEIGIVLVLNTVAK